MSIFFCFCRAISSCSACFSNSYTHRTNHSQLYNTPLRLIFTTCALKLSVLPSPLPLPLSLLLDASRRVSSSSLLLNSSLLSSSLSPSSLYSSSSPTYLDSSSSFGEREGRREGGRRGREGKRREGGRERGWREGGKEEGGRERGGREGGKGGDREEVGTYVTCYNTHD